MHENVTGPLLSFVGVHPVIPESSVETHQANGSVVFCKRSRSEEKESELMKAVVRLLSSSRISKSASMQPGRLAFPNVYRRGGLSMPHRRNLNLDRGSRSGPGPHSNHRRSAAPSAPAMGCASA